MNKKLISALLLPLMIMPLMGFAYAHWTDKVTKQIKMHAGSVEVEIVQWHIDRCNSYDVDCDGVIFGDELKVEMITDPAGQVIEIYITANPVYPCWILEFKFLVHNKGKMTIESDVHLVDWEGPFDEDPCWLLTQPYPDQPIPPECIFYEETLLLHDYGTYPGCEGVLCTDKSHYTLPVAPTTYILKPSQCVLVKEFIHFDCQEKQAEYECKWFRLAKEMVFAQHIGDEWGSEGWP